MAIFQFITKLRDFYCASLAENYDVLAITETWLSSDVYNNEILDARYSIYRNDRNALNSIKGRGGGVMLAVSSKYESLQLTNVNKEVEEIWVKIITGKRDLILCCVYLLPKSDLSKFSSHIVSLQNICNNHPDSDIIVLGDFNLPNIEWTRQEDLSGLVPCNVTAKNEILDCDSYFSLCFSQFNNLRNAYDNVLDLCFANCVSIELSPCVPLLKLDTSHPTFCISLDTCGDNFDYNKGEWIYDFNHVDYIGINTFLSNVNNFYFYLYSARDLFVPLKCKCSSTYPKWFNSDVIGLLKAKKSAHKLYKRNRCDSNYRKFSELRSRCKLAISEAYDNYLAGVESDLRRIYTCQVAKASY
jgi:hypothetical protein